ncbi:glucose dehydrogenase [FAD, quinone]-like [Atheta coriaria]|uniref:glucose dehydrogenase [FAD, quinone]-like n=1 Tax=Dalotia coriaria TaxID=877792 RepID=UPI0031F4580D
MQTIIVFGLCNILLSTALGQATDAENNTLIDYYENLIDDTISKFDTYTAPVDANEYKGNFYDQRARHKDFGEYDFVVIGGGSSGSVVAARLSEVPQWKILLLEAGERENNFTNIPGLYFYSRFTNYNWGYLSVPQRHACQGMIDKRCPFPRGRGLGGTSLINGVIYSRGHRKDFDTWNSYLANGTWSYDHVLPYFKKSEHTHIPNVDLHYHGQSGPLPINNHVPVSPQTNAFLEAHQELGMEITDINGAEQIGAALNQLITENGQRVSTARGYLGTTRSNLDILTGAYVTKILIRNRRATGVEFTYQGKKSKVRITKEVILSGGVFGSPLILMHSGIGPLWTLLQHGIPIVRNSPYVGLNLQDHATFYGMIFQSNYTEPIKSRRQYIREYLQGIGPYTIAANLEGISFHETHLSQTSGVPDIELLFVPSNSTGRANQQSFHLTNISYDAIWKHTDPTTTFIVYVVLLRPRSFGYISLKSKDPFDYPLIHPNFLSDRNNLDIATIFLGVQHVLKLIDTEAFKRINASLIEYTFPACKNTLYLSKEYWYCTIRQITMNVYHPLGTCAMKDEELGGVVDGELKVYGVGKLRVIDASVIPFSISGHPHASAVMIGEKGADLIKEEYGMLKLSYIR